MQGEERTVMCVAEVDPSSWSFHLMTGDFQGSFCFHEEGQERVGTMCGPWPPAGEQIVDALTVKLACLAQGYSRYPMGYYSRS